MNMRWLNIFLAIASATWAGPLKAADQVTMQLGWTPGGERSFYYVAREEGLFAAENLDVRITPGKGATDSITRVATGTVDFSEGGLDALLTARSEQNVPVKAVLALYTIMPDGLMTTTASGIKTLKDVEGKTVATATATSSNGVWPFILKMNGADPDKVKLIKAEPTTLAPMLATGQVDATIQFVSAVPNYQRILGEVKKELVVVPWAQYGLDGYSNSLYVSEQTLATRRDVVVRFVRAVKKAVALMENDPGIGARALKKSVPEADVAAVELSAKAALPLLFNENTKRDGLGVFTPARVKTTWDWVVKQTGAAPDKIDPMTAVDLTIVQN